ncbi:MAG TPA: hypothetical protein VGF99_06630 [Myxococcota bacterium]
MPKPSGLPCALIVVAAVVGGGCSSVDCETLCRKTLECNVAFAPSDDPDENKIVTGERTEIESCALGCEESPIVDVDAADCLDGVAATGDLDTCQPQMLQCLGLDEAVNGGSSA